MFSFQNVTFELKYIKTDTSVSRQNTQKFSQSQSRSQSESLVAPCLTSIFEVFVLKFHHRDRRSPRCLGKIRHHLFKVLVDPLVCVALALFWMEFEGCSHNGSMEG